ncbi:MAG: DUF1972 domain-containing protein [Halobacteriota archaeon]
MKPSIAIIGSRGIPAKYGGFETVTERLAPSLGDDGYDVWVSCGAQTHRISRVIRESSSSTFRLSLSGGHFTKRYTISSP